MFSPSVLVHNFLSPNFLFAGKSDRISAAGVQLVKNCGAIKINGGVLLNTTGTVNKTRLHIVTIRNVVKIARVISPRLQLFKHATVLYLTVKGKRKPS